MEDQMIFIVTNAEAGWDCIMSVHKTIESIQKFYGLTPDLDTTRKITDYLNERETAIYVIHQSKLLS